MKKFNVTSDICSVTVGNDSFCTTIFNGFGDGDTEVRVYDNPEEVRNEKETEFKNGKYVTTIYGHFYVFSEDTFAHYFIDGSAQKNLEEGVICSLNGVYEVYTCGSDFIGGAVSFVKIS